MRARRVRIWLAKLPLIGRLFRPRLRRPPLTGVDPVAPIPGVRREIIFSQGWAIDRAARASDMDRK